MNLYGLDKGNNSWVSDKKTSKDEWSKVVDRVEAAILTSLANRILADAADRQNQIDEHRKQLKLVDLRNFSRKDSVG